MKSMHALAGALLALTLACQAGPDNADAANAGTAAAAAPVAAAATPTPPPPNAVPQGQVVYLDVRTPEEFAAGHVEGAVLVPHDQVGARLAELEQYRDRDIVVYCRSGRRSAIAIEVLQANGFTRLTNGGGFTDLAQRVPVE